MSTGYTVVNRRWWVLLIPIMLDMYLWLGARLSLAPFFTLIHDKITSVAGFIASEPAQREQLVVHIQNADMRAPLSLLNYVPTLPLSLLHQDGLVLSDHVLYIRGATSAIISVLAINMLALLMSSVFLTILTSGVAGEACGIGHCLRRAVQVTLRLAGLFAVLAGLIFIIGLPFFVFTVVVITRVPSVMALVLFAWFIIWFWLYLYTGFAIEATVLNQVGPFKALFSSMSLVQQNFLGAIGLLLLSGIIFSGMGVIWEQLAGSVVGLVFAIGGSAYIGSGLAAARLVFFQQRMHPPRGLTEGSYDVVPPHST